MRASPPGSELCAVGRTGRLARVGPVIEAAEVEHVLIREATARADARASWIRIDTENLPARTPDPGYDGRSRAVLRRHPLPRSALARNHHQHSPRRRGAAARAWRRP